MSNDHRATVLVVDDDYRVRHTLTDILRFVGYEVLTAASGAEALSIDDIEHVDCIVSDIRMQDMNGVELCHSVKARFPSMPVILMSAYSNRDVLRDAFSAGAAAALMKPFDVEELLAIIRDTCTTATPG